MNHTSVPRACLGVTHSVTGRYWCDLAEDQGRMAQAMAQRTDIAPHLCRILARQQVSLDDAEDYLEPTMTRFMPDPSSLLDMDKAVERFVVALENRENIAIFADYDVDGASSAAQLIWWLRYFDRKASLYVPDRSREGFGPNPDAMRKLAESHSLIICVDCGTSAHDAIAAAQGADVIIIDHHLGEDKLPHATAIINPNRQDETSELTYLCAAGVVFMFLVALNRRLRNNAVEVCDLHGFLDLVALATVADASPLIGLNRALVRRGLKEMSYRKRPGIRALADVSNLKTKPDSHALGFLLGPRINAPGRIGEESDLGARLLATDDDFEAEAIASEVERLNQKRRAMVDAAANEALERIAASQNNEPLVWAASSNWHPGVAGIIAARLVDASGRPAIAIAIGDETSRGSARSVPGFDIGAAMHRCRNEGLLISGGGHKMAAGLEIETDKIEPAMARLSEIATHMHKNGDSVQQYRIDSVIQPDAATIDMVRSLEAAGPYGSAAPAPRFAFPNLLVVYRRWVGTGHLQLRLRGETGVELEAIAFRADQSPLGQFLDRNGLPPVHIVGRLQENNFRGQIRVQIQVHDAAPANR